MWEPSERYPDENVRILDPSFARYRRPKCGNCFSCIGIIFHRRLQHFLKVIFNAHHVPRLKDRWRLKRARPADHVIDRSVMVVEISPVTEISHDRPRS